MFDYQAGEKYKLTLIMVALAGLLAGIFFTILLMPAPEPPRRRPMAKYMSDPDVTGAYSQQAETQQRPNDGGINQAPPLVADVLQTRNMIDSFLPLAWDLNAYSARASQERALSFMTSECAQQYKQNIWTDAVASQIEESGVSSTFSAKQVNVGQLQADGSVVVTVAGQQSLSVPGKPGKTRDVKVEYLVRQFPEGLRIAGISEVGQRTQ